MPAADFCELIIEETPRYEGAPTTSPYRLATEKLYLPVRSARLGPAPSHLSRADELRGLLAEPPRLIDRFDPDGSISMRCYLKDLTWLLHLCGLTGTKTAGDGIITDPDGQTIPTGAQRWVFTKHDAIDAHSAQISLNYKDEGLMLRGQGYACSQLQLNAAGELTCDLVGLVLKRLALDTTTTPSYTSSAIPPIRRGDLFVSWLAGGGPLADFSVSLANSLERVASLSLATPSNYPDRLEYGNEQVTLTGSIPKRILDADDVDALLAASTFSAKARWKTPKNIGATSYKYSLWIEMPACQLVGGQPDELGNVRRVGASYDWVATYDETAGYDFKITIVNDVTSIATFA
jgi:hypothetical protein